MNRKQWLVFAVGISIFSLLLWTLATGWNATCTETLGNYNIKSAQQLGLKGVEPINTYDVLLISEMQKYTSCVIKAQSYAIPAMFCTVFALIFFICAWLEPKKK